MKTLPILSLLLLTLVTYGQEAAEISCRILRLEGTKLPPPLVAVTKVGGDETTEVAFEVFPDRFTDSLTFTYVGNTLNFFTADGRKPAAKVTIPKNLKSAVLLFVDGQTGAGSLPWKVFVIDDSPKNLPDGGAYVANFNNGNIRFVIGENKFMLKPGGIHSVGTPKERTNFNMAQVMFLFQKGDKWEKVSQSMMHFVPGMRYLIFAYTDSAGRPRVSPYKYNLPPPAKPAAAKP